MQKLVIVCITIVGVGGLTVAALALRDRGEDLAADLNDEPIPENGPETLPAGRAELLGIRGDWAKYADAHPDADLNRMALEFWFPFPFPKSEVASTGRADRYLITLTALSMVEDDTGLLLSTPKRIAGCDYLHREVRSTGEDFKARSRGPVATVVLDRPVRRASSIRAITGKAVVTRFGIAHVRYDDLSAVSGVPLADPRLGGIIVTPDVESKGTETVVTLTMPEFHPRLLAWALSRGGRSAGFTREWGSDRGGGRFAIHRAYTRGWFGNDGLVLAVAVPLEVKSFEFDIRDFQLP